MKRKVVLILFFGSVLMGCSRKLSPAISECIQSKINEIKAQSKWNPPAQINEYEYNGKKVYLITANCCDQFITLVDEQCNYVCAPSGGITGKGDGKCTNFYRTAKHIKLVWKDER